MGPDEGRPPLTPERILEIRDSLFPPQGEPFDFLAFARAIEAEVDDQYGNMTVDIQSIFDTPDLGVGMPDDVRVQWLFIRDGLNQERHYQSRIGKFVDWMEGRK